MVSNGKPIEIFRIHLIDICEVRTIIKVGHDLLGGGEQPENIRLNSNGADEEEEEI